MDLDSGRIVTVDGRIDPENLGVTLPHEHLFADWREIKYEEPSSAVERRLAAEPVSLDNLWFINRHYFQNTDNLLLDSFEIAVEEILRYQRAGGDALVDVTPKGCGGDPEVVRAVSRETGVTMVQGTAFYTRDAHPDRVDDMNIEEIATEFATDVTDGISDTRVRAGVIGEIGLTGHIHEQEERVLRGAARAAVRTGAPITIHSPGGTAYSQKDGTYPASRWGLDVLDIVAEEGLQPEQVILGHMDMSGWHEDTDYQARLADRGAFIEYDIFGQKRFLYKQGMKDAFPSDIERVQKLISLIKEGYASQLLVSHDVFLKNHLTAFGGFGYAHLLKNIVPVFREFGVSDDDLTELLATNPQRALTFA